MRLVFVPHAYAPSIGGAQTYTRGLAEGLARSGHEVHVVAPDVANPEAFYELGHRRLGLPDSSLGGVSVHRLPLLSAAYRMGRMMGKSRSLQSSLTRYRAALASTLELLHPDVVITLPHLFPNVEETLALRPGAPWRVVYAPMLHEADPYWSIARVAAAVARCDGVMALTSHERDRLLEAYASPSARTAVVSPGVDVPRGEPPSVRSDEVLVLGRRELSKRLDVVQAAMAIVGVSRPEARLVIAGPASRGDTSVGSDRVDIIDSPDDAERERLLFRAALVVSASLTESFGLNLIEAWAHGAPVVAVDTPVAREIVRSGDDGLLTAADPAALAAGILEMLEDPRRANRMGAAGRDRVVADFTWNRAAMAFDRMIAGW